MSQIQCTIIEVKGWQQEDWPKSPAEEAIKTAEKCRIKNYPTFKQPGSGHTCHT